MRSILIAALAVPVAQQAAEPVAVVTSTSDINFWLLIVALGALTLELLVVIVGGVWIVANIKATTAVLAAAVVSLQKTLGDLERWLGRMDGRVGAVEQDTSYLKGQLNPRADGPR